MVKIPGNPVGKEQAGELLRSELKEATNDTINEATPPEVLGEQLVSGSDPDPESDDDTLLNEHQVGLRLNEDEENPQPLDIAGDVSATEKRRHGSDNA